MATAYFDRNGDKVSLADWKALQAQPGYITVRKFDNEKLRIELFWVGFVKNSQNYMPDYRPLFKMECWNRVMSYDGGPLGWAEDPMLHCKTYATEAAGIKAYQDFLATWTDSGYGVNKQTGNKEFHEAGNIHTPPPPPDPDAPSISSLGAKDCDDVGAW